MNLKSILIFLSTLAVILGIFTYFSVFGNASGTYAINPLPTSSGAASGTVFIFATSTMPSSSATGGGSGGGGGSSGGTGFYGSAFTMPPLVWTDGGAKLSVTSAALQDNQLTFTLTIDMGPSPACVALNLRLVADESGNLQGPDTPAFSFPDSGNCNGAPNATYANQTASFTVVRNNFPLLFTTGGAANIFFEVATTSANGLQIDFPSTSG